MLGGRLQERKEGVCAVSEWWEGEYRGTRGYSIYVGPNRVRYIVGGQKK